MKITEVAHCNSKIITYQTYSRCLKLFYMKKLTVIVFYCLEGSQKKLRGEK